MAKPRTLYDKIWDDHVVETQADGTSLHLHRPPPRPRGDEPAGLRGPAHDRPQGARAGEDARRRRPQHPDDRPQPAASPIPRAALQVEQLAENAREFGIEYYNEFDRAPGHRPHHRAGAGLHAAGHDHRLRRQPHLDARRLRRARARHRHLRGRACAGDADADPGEGQEHARRASTARCRDGVTAKDIILAIIGEIGTAGGTGHVIEYAGEAIRALSMEGRMTVCNMSIEGGARAGLIAPDEKTFAYLEGPAEVAQGRAVGSGVALLGDAAHRRGRAFRRDGARSTPPTCRRSSPGAPARRTSSSIDGVVPRVEDGATRPSAPRSSARSTTWASRAARRSPTSRSTACSSAPAPTAASRICAPRPRSSRASKVAERVNAMVVPGSGLVKEQAEAEGLDKIFIAAGFEWREPGCSMCLAMNPDKLAPGERCASTSNRNFEGRQGYKGRTHLVSPAMAAAAAIAGRFVDVREWRCARASSGEAARRGVVRSPPRECYESRRPPHRRERDRREFRALLRPRRAERQQGRERGRIALRRAPLAEPAQRRRRRG